jgi:hypothetical protein
MPFAPSFPGVATLERVAAMRKPAPIDASDGAPELAARFQRVWRQGILIVALMVTAAWMVLLGYGLVEL